VLLKQDLRALRALLSQQDRFCFRRRVRDVAPLMEAIEGIPVLTFPCPPIWATIYLTHKGS